MSRIILFVFLVLVACQKQQLDLAEVKDSKSTVKTEYSVKPELNPAVKTN